MEILENYGFTISNNSAPLFFLEDEMIQMNILDNEDTQTKIIFEEIFFQFSFIDFYIPDKNRKFKKFLIKSNY